MEIMGQGTNERRTQDRGDRSRTPSTPSTARGDRT
jgi:hypothetical protein